MLSMNRPITQATKQQHPLPKVQASISGMEWQSVSNTIDSMTLTHHTHLSIW